MYGEELDEQSMPDTKTLNEEWEQRIKRVFQRSSSEANITNSKSLWDLARRSEAIRLNWLNQIPDRTFLSEAIGMD